MRPSPRLLRSAVDATRFTATSPHAYSAPTPIRRAAAGTFSPSSSSHSAPSRSQPKAANLNPSVSQHGNGRSPPPPPPSRPARPATPTETPMQKVARLRAARLAEKEAQVSTWDKVVVSGREWADRIHRTVAWGLILFTVLAGCVTIYALTDMVVYNRRKRNAWLADQYRNNEELVLSAIANEKAGLSLTEDQELALNNERARFEAEERKKAKGGWGRWLLMPFESVVGGLKGDDVEAEAGEGGRGGVVDRVGQRVYEAEEGMVDGLQKVEGEVVQGVRRAERNLKEAVTGNLTSGGKQAEEGVLAAVHEVEGAASGRSREGGPLDQLADNVVETGKEKIDKVKGGWGSWFGGK